MSLLKNTLTLALLGSVACGLFVTDAVAWGPRAQRAIGITGVQMTRRTVTNAFRTEETDYEADVIDGMLAGPDALRNSVQTTGDAEIANLIGREIQLLRKMAEYNQGSFFAYRMGILGSLMSNTVLPYGLDRTAEGRRLVARMRADIDANLKAYAFEPKQKALFYIRDPKTYLAKRRPFFDNASLIIKADYDEGTGYDGCLSSSANAFFEEAVQAVADSWYTVLRAQAEAQAEAEAGMGTPSDEAMTWYFADAIEYLLLTKDNLAEAEKVYTLFVGVNPGICEAYEHVGDSFYAAGARDRGVREWKTALTFAGVHRAKLLRKLAQHFVGEGKDHLAQIGQPEAPENALDEGLRSFETAFQYDPADVEIEDLITKTKVEIGLRDERRELATQTVASGEEVMREAEANEAQEQFGNAIQNYRKAIEVFEFVDDEFKGWYKKATDGREECGKRIDRIITAVLDLAHDSIDEGDRRLANNQFDAARDEYARVEEVLANLPEDVDEFHLQDKGKLIEEAQQKAADVDVAEERHKQELERARKAAEAAAAAAGNQ